MAKRLTQQKKLRRLEKALRPDRETKIDLIQWLKLRRHADTTGQAKRLLIDGRVRSESHVVGREEVQRASEVIEYVAAPIVPASLRDTLQVV